MSSIKSSSTAGLNNKWQSMVGDATVLANTFKTHYLDKKRKSKDQNPRLDLNKKYHDW